MMKSVLLGLILLIYSCSSKRQTKELAFLPITESDCKDLRNQIDSFAASVKYIEYRQAYYADERFKSLVKEAKSNISCYYNILTDTSEKEITRIMSSSIIMNGLSETEFTQYCRKYINSINSNRINKGVLLHLLVYQDGDCFFAKRYKQRQVKELLSNLLNKKILSRELEQTFIDVKNGDYWENVKYNYE